MKKILVIAPHADDEILGVGGYLVHQVAEKAEIYIALATIGGTNPRQVSEVRKAEFKQVKSRLGVTRDFILYDNMDALLDTIPTLDIARKLDEVLRQVEPDEVFLNYSSHHQDHKKLFDCALISFRLKAGHNPKMIALYEYPFVGNHYDSIHGGSWYHDISDVIEEKIRLFNCYSSQVCDLPSPLNEEGIRTLARIRGLECGVRYAEKFYIQKMIR